MLRYHACYEGPLQLLQLVLKPTGLAWLGLERTLGHTSFARSIAVAAAPEPRPPGWDPAKFSRKKLEGRQEAHQCLIRGVSFEGRQVYVQQLQKGRPLMLLKEPWNPFDEHAVGVYNLQGDKLGFIPRAEAQNQKFQHEFQTGEVVSVGASKVGLFGARLKARPGIMDVSIDPLPKAYAHYAALENVLPASILDRLKQEALKRARHNGHGDIYCQVTGVSDKREGMELVPVWRYNESRKAVELSRAAVVCVPVLKAKQCWNPATDMSFDFDPDKSDIDVPDGVLTFLELNGWAMGDFQCYQQYLNKLQHKMDNENWVVDVTVS